VIGRRGTSRGNEQQASAAEGRRDLVGWPLAAEEEQGTGRAPGDASPAGSLPSALACPAGGGTEEKAWRWGSGCLIWAEQRSRGGPRWWRSRGVGERAGGVARSTAPHWPPCLPGRRRRGGGGTDRRGRRTGEEVFLPTCCWRRSFLPARAGFCAQCIWAYAYPILQWLVGVSLKASHKYNHVQVFIQHYS
jgi:hypothetical protein